MSSHYGSDQSPVMVFGGTFDPVHNGHLRTATELGGLFTTGAEVRMIPCSDPQHRQAPGAHGRHRLAMLKLATGPLSQPVENEPVIKVDDVEIRRSGPTYTVDTLAGLRADIGARPLVLVMGSDAFQQLHQWHRWLEIIQLAHIMVIRRPNWSVSGQPLLRDFYRRYSTNNLSELQTRRAGKLAECQLTQLDISATVIRNQLASGQSPRYLLPDVVLDYIVRHQLYGAPLPSVYPTASDQTGTK